MNTVRSSSIPPSSPRSTATGARKEDYTLFDTNGLVASLLAAADEHDRSSSFSSSPSDSAHSTTRKRHYQQQQQQQQQSKEYGNIYAAAAATAFLDGTSTSTSTERRGKRDRQGQQQTHTQTSTPHHRLHNRHTPSQHTDQQDHQKDSCASSSSLGATTTTTTISKDTLKTIQPQQQQHNPMAALFGKKKIPQDVTGGDNSDDTEMITPQVTKDSVRWEKKQNEGKTKDYTISNNKNNNIANLPRSVNRLLSSLQKYHSDRIQHPHSSRKHHRKTSEEDALYATQNPFLAIFRKIGSLWTNRDTTKAGSSSSKQGISDSADRNIGKVTTEIIDKILKSNFRLLAIANLLLAVTYLLHSAVVDLFLNQSSTPDNTTPTNVTGPTNNTRPPTETIGGGVGASTSNRISRSGRERLGGYLFFKLLLVSAVVNPDTLDLLILLSWYTLLSFLKSLSYLAGVTTAHASAAGQSPHRGVLKLLLVVLSCDVSAAIVCTALFHGAGWSMVVLLTCDCVLLGVDVLTHLARFAQQALEEVHQRRLREIEARQIRLQEEIRRNDVRNGSGDDNAGEVVGGSDDGSGGLEEDGNDEEEKERDENSYEEIPCGETRDSLNYEGENSNNDDSREASIRYEEQIEVLETTHQHHLGILDYTAFVLGLLASFLTICHFLHIWSIHGIAFNLVDGVLALHLHTAISAAGKKIVERRNHNRIARELDTFFEDANELEMRKASVAGDVCCICLGTMSMGNVKKVGCGHLYHTNCLREIVERARSIEAAKCPLCRASIVNGMQFSNDNSQNGGIPGMPPGVFIFGFGNNTQPTVGRRNVQDNVDGGVLQNRQQQEDNNRNNTNNGGGDVGRQDIEPLAGAQILNPNERPLFRFSTEGFLPAWLPLPALSFEVVRRPLVGTDADGDTNATLPQPIVQQQPQPQQPQPQLSYYRRLLALAGAISMSPEEEALAASQLVDMFPQYDRADLLRELRDRGSITRVVEAVLSGTFSGIARPGAI